VSQLAASSLKPEGLNSGRAIREFSDIQSDRLHVPSKSYEQMFMDIGRLSIEVVKIIAAQNDGKTGYEVRVPGKKSVARVDWNDISLKEDDVVMQIYPVSSLPQDPAGRLQTIQEYAQAGFLSPRQARRLLDFPDLEQVETLANAEEDYLYSVFDKIVDDGDYSSPDPLDDLQLSKQLCLEYYAQGKLNNLREDRLELLRRYLAQIAEIEQAMMPPPPPEAIVPGMTGAPLAPPMPMGPSDLVPNVPVQ
jgi:hypothetical protein